MTNTVGFLLILTDKVGTIMMMNTRATGGR